jgi:circadian clock protein KaiB
VLYVAQGTQNSALAVANLSALCREQLPSRHEIEVVDVFKEPARALANRIFMTPTLIQVSPAPVRRVVGTLSQPGRVLALESNAA